MKVGSLQSHNGVAAHLHAFKRAKQKVVVNLCFPLLGSRQYTQCEAFYQLWQV